MYGFQQQDLATRSKDGHNFVLLEPLVFETKVGVVYHGIVGAQTDGASVPQEFWNVYPPFGGYWLAAVLHDCAYRCMLEKQVGDKWVRVQLSKDECDALLLEALEYCKINGVTTTIIYNAVHKAGDSSYITDLSQPIK